jgi:hypothetical protein
MTKTVTVSKPEPEPLKTFYIVSIVKASSEVEARNLASIMMRAGYVDKIQSIREAK